MAVLVRNAALVGRIGDQHGEEVFRDVDVVFHVGTTVTPRRVLGAEERALPARDDDVALRAGEAVDEA